MFFTNTMKVREGDVLVIPAPNDKHKKDENKISIHWQQMFRQRDGDYYVLVAKNKTQGYAEVAFYIQSEWYNEPGFNSAYNMRRIDDDNYEIAIDDRHQYAGRVGEEVRFVVWHDKDRKPYADRFVPGLLKFGTDAAKQVLGLLRLQESPAGTAVEWAGELGQTFVGKELYTF